MKTQSTKLDTRHKARHKANDTEWNLRSTAMNCVTQPLKTTTDQPSTGSPVHRSARITAHLIGDPELRRLEEPREAPNW